MHNVDAEVPAHRGARRALARSLVRAGAPRSSSAVPLRPPTSCCASPTRTASYFEGLGAPHAAGAQRHRRRVLRRAHPLPPGERVLFFGRLDYAPNELGLTRFLREGWPRLAAARPDATLRVAGPGLGAALRREIAAAQRAQALGVVDDLAAELAESRAVVLPVWHGGGTRLKALEAMAAARPVAGTALSGRGDRLPRRRPRAARRAPGGAGRRHRRAARRSGRATALAHRRPRARRAVPLGTGDRAARRALRALGRRLIGGLEPRA